MHLAALSINHDYEGQSHAAVMLSASCTTAHATQLYKNPIMETHSCKWEVTLATQHCPKANRGYIQKLKWKNKSRIVPTSGGNYLKTDPR